MFEKLDDMRKKLILRSALAKFKGECETWDEEKDDEALSITFLHTKHGEVGGVITLTPHEVEITLNITGKLAEEILNIFGWEYGEPKGDTEPVDSEDEEPDKEPDKEGEQ
jgi:hypothetical protein